MGGNISEIRYGGSRDVATILLKTPVLMKGRHDPVMSIELTSERGSAVLGAMLTGNKHDDDYESAAESDEEYDTKALPPKTQGMKVSLQSTKGLDSLFADGEPFQKLLEASIPDLELELISKQLVAEDWSIEDSLILEFFHALGGTEMNWSPSIDESDGAATVKIRELTMMMPVPPAPMCPKATSMTVTLRVCVNNGPQASVTIEQSAVSHDVPFGSNFIVQDRTVLASEQANSVVSVTRSCRVVFLKSCGFLKSKIQSGVVTGQTSSGDIFLGLLRKRAPMPIVRVRSDLSHVPKHIESVWEVQRRTTIFNADWRAPFLPHDRNKRWKWLDDSYNRHGWLAGSRDDVAAAETPPLVPGVGLTPCGDWTVRSGSNEMSHNTDEDGWQYAIDLYRGDSHYGTGKTGMSVRRRLWTCTFVKTSDIESLAADLG